MTKFYGIDVFPPHVSPSYKRFWLAESVSILKAQERIEEGDVDLDHIFDVALLAYGDEEKASDIKVAKMKAMNERKSRGG